jgi:retrograde regulation protein 2
MDGSLTTGFSNGIRFSISDLSEPTTRCLTAVMVYRSSISLYDAQFDDTTGAQIPIPKGVVDAVCHALRRFQIICTDFKVEHDQIHVLATEAARVAKNSAELLGAIKATTGLDVKLLDKEEEGNIGALGIASGFMSMEGLVMDLGGGSTQISWIVSQNGSIRTSPRGSFGKFKGRYAFNRRHHLLTLSQYVSPFPADSRKVAKQSRQQFFHYKLLSHTC